MSRKQTTSLRNTVDRERLRVAATVTQETDWPQSEPNQGLARMFVIMLLVHVVVIGGIIIYDFIGESNDSKQATAAINKVNATTAAAAKTAPARSSSDALPIVKDTTPAPAPAPSPTPAPAVAKSNPESLLPPNAPPVIEPVKAQPVASTPPAPVPVATPVKIESAPPPSVITTSTSPRVEKKGSLSIVELPDASPVSAQMKPAAPVAAKPVVKEEPPKPKPEAQVEARRAVMLGSSLPKPVAPPTELRKTSDSEKRSSTTASTKKKVEDTPPVTKKKSETTSSTKKSSDTPSKKESSTSTKGTRHTIKKGDTLYSLARRYKTTTDAIIKANSIKNPDVLPDGKVLVIPGK